MIRNSRGIYQFALFLKYPHIIHGFSTRECGSLSRDNTEYKKNLQTFADTLSIDSSDIVAMEQIHGNTVAGVTKSDKGTFVSNTDGLFTLISTTFLLVRTADCVPLLLFEKEKDIVAVVHAGWKGAIKNIVSVTIREMVKNGADPEKIIAGIGPSIRSCCYDIDDERVSLFTQQFPTYRDKIIENKNGKSYLNLQSLITEQLCENGLQRDTIEDSMLCTSDHDEFYSYRKREGVEYGLFGGIIGIQ